MAGLLLRHRGPVATAVSAVALVLAGTAWSAAGHAGDGHPWLSIVALAYCSATAGLFVYLRSDRAREALDDATDSSLAAAQVMVALSPTVVAGALHIAGAERWVIWFVLGVTVAQLVVWSGLATWHRQTSGE